MGGDPTLQGVTDDAQRDGSDASGASIQAAIAATERGVRAEAARYGGVPEGEEGGFEWRALRTFAAAHGRLISPGAYVFGPGGREHDVCYLHTPDVGSRWIKATHPWYTGYTVELVEGRPLLLNATALPYLRRLQLQIDMFGNDLRFQGVIEDPGGWRCVTSQRHIDGLAPTLHEIDEGLVAFGFHRLDIEHMGYEGSHSYLMGNIGLFDAHPANFRISEGILVPIDVILVEFSPEDAACLQQRLA